MNTAPSVKRINKNANRLSGRKTYGIKIEIKVIGRYKQTNKQYHKHDMKPKYRPERQKMYSTDEAVFYFCHGTSQEGKHVDCVMKSSVGIPESELLMSQDGSFRHPLIFVRPATNTEVIEYCI